MYRVTTLNVATDITVRDLAGVLALRVILVMSYKELPVFRTIVIQVVRVRDVRLV